MMAHTAGSLGKSHGKTLAFNNEPEAYKNLQLAQDAKRDELLSSAKRFQRISEREDRSAKTSEAWKSDSVGRNLQRYRGFDICKCPIDYVLYHQALDLVKPKTVFELGTMSGGMAIWIADNLDLLGVKDTKIYSMDLDTSIRSALVNKLKPPNVTFLQGDAYEIEKTFTEELLKSLPHPWILSEDCHANFPAVLRYFHKFFREGDYMVIEDTCPDIGVDLGMYMAGEGAFRKLGRGKLDELREFLQEYEDFYSVDSFLTDLFGYNCSWHWHGFVRKMK